MKATANFSLVDEESNIRSEGEANVILDDQFVTLVVEFGEPMLFSYTDIVGISEQEYRIKLFLTSKETLNLSGLGYQYEDFLSELFRLRNEILLKYMLMEESLISSGFNAQFSWFDSKGQINQSGNCELRFYETALLILPQKNEPIRVPYCYVQRTSKIEFRLFLNNEFGERFEFSKLGDKFDAFGKSLSDALNKMLLRSQTIIKEMIPETDPLTTYKLAALMKDGRAARRKDIEALSTDLWRRLTKRIGEAGMDQEYGFLDAMSLKDQECVGVKRGLMGDLTGDYVWLQFPLCGSGSNRLLNAVALEAFSTSANDEQIPEVQAKKSDSTEASNEDDTEEKGSTSSGKATYFFRILSRQAYAQTGDAELKIELDNFIRNINRCMIEINFRREPIYLSDDTLDSPKYNQYRFAVTKIPSLKVLRNLFIGRVIHSSFDQWKKDVTDLLDFNSNINDDSKKWTKGAE
ncbi:MAG: hypothetical protein ABSA75_02855 [Candidatus Bathyarchaeia archaeon]